LKLKLNKKDSLHRKNSTIVLVILKSLFNATRQVRNCKGKEECTLVYSAQIYRGEVVSSEKLSHKNAIKHEKSGPRLDFLTTPSTPLKRIWPKPQGPPRPPLDFQLVCIYDSASLFLIKNAFEKLCFSSKCKSE